MNLADSSANQLAGRLIAFFGTENFKLEKQPGGASSREFYRIAFAEKTYFPARDVMLMQVPAADSATLEDYVAMDYYFLRNDVKTPRLYEMVGHEGWVFSEFIHTPTVEQYLATRPADAPLLAGRMLDFLAQMQSTCRPENACPAFQRRFDFAKYRFEFDFHFKEELLVNYCGFVAEDAVISRFSDQLSRELNLDYPVLVHRDFQSSNVLLCAESPLAELAIVDFQDARYGTPLYDLVSCLWDSYVSLEDDFRSEEVERFAQTEAVKAMNLSKEEYSRLVDLTATQRKLHDAGAFAYNYRRFGSDRYLGYIRSAVLMAYLRLQKYTEYSGAVKLLEKVLQKLG